MTALSRRRPTRSQACGTYAGYHRHYRRREIPCDRCCEAARQYHNDKRLAPARRAVLDAEVSIYERQRRSLREAS